MERSSPDELISAYFDGETTPEESAVVERLLADPKRRQTLEDFRHLREELRAMPTPALSSAWNSRLRERLAAAKPAWSESSVAESIAPPAKPFSNDGKIEKPVASGGAAAKSFSTGEQVEPAPLVSAPERLPRGDGYSRFRQLWLAAGVGVAAGTLGIVIGWSAQTLRSEAVDLQVAVGDATTSPAPQAAETTEFMAAADESNAPSSGAAFAPAWDGAVPEPPGVETFGAESTELRTGGSGAYRADFAEQNGQSVVPQAEESAAYAMPESTSGLADVRGDDDVAALDEVEAMKKAEEKQLERSSGAWHSRKEDRLSGARGMRLADGAEGEAIAGDRESQDYFATYLGVWEPAGVEGLDRSASLGEKELLLETLQSGLSGLRASSLEDETNDAFIDKSQVAGSRNEATSLSFENASLSLEGSPEQVAKALEILAGPVAGGRVQLLGRADENGRFVEPERALRRNELADEVDAQMRSELESAETLRDKNGEREARQRFADERAQLLAMNGTASAMDRIESFFLYDTTKDRPSMPGPPIVGGAFGGFGYGGGGEISGARALGGGSGAGSGGSGLDAGGMAGRPLQEERSPEVAQGQTFAAPAADAARTEGLAGPANAPAIMERTESAPAGSPLSRVAQNAAGSPPPPAPASTAPEPLAEETPTEPSAPPADEPGGRAMRRVASATGEAAVEALVPETEPAGVDPARPKPNAEAPPTTLSAAPAPASAAGNSVQAPPVPGPPAPAGGDAPADMKLAQQKPVDPEASAPSLPPRASQAESDGEAEGHSFSIIPREFDRSFSWSAADPYGRLTFDESSGLAGEAPRPAPRRVRVILLVPDSLAQGRADAGVPAAGPAVSAEPASVEPATPAAEAPSP